MTTRVEIIIPSEQDREYLRQKIKRCKTQAEAAKHIKQLELLEDAVVIYKLYH